MKKALTRGISLVLSAILLMVVFSGCGEKEEVNPTVGTTAGTTTGTTAAASEAVDDRSKTYEINWLGGGNFEVDPEGPIKKWMEERYNVKLNIWFLAQNQRTQALGLKIASGEIPDVWNETSSGNLVKYAEQGVIAEIPVDMIKNYAAGYTKMIDELDPQIWKTPKYDGKNYSLPGFNYMSAFSKPVAWRKDWLEKFGYTEAPKTLEQFEEVFYKFTNNDPDGNGQNDTHALSLDGLSSIYGAFGTTRGIYMLKDGKVVYSSIQPGMKEALALLQKWYKDKVIDPEYVTGEGKSGTSEPFVNGRIGYSNKANFYNWMPPGYQTNYEGSNYTSLKKIQGDKADILMGTLPTGPRGESGIWLGNLLGINIVMGKQVEGDPGKMARILTMLNDVYTDPVVSKTVRWGFEGQHWDADAKGNVVQKAEFSESTNLEGLVKMGSHTTFFWYWTPNTFQSMNPGQYEFALKFTPISSNYRSVVQVALPSASTYTDLGTKEDEVFTKIIMGQLDISAFDTFVEDWKKQGGDILTQEANEEYNRK